WMVNAYTLTFAVLLLTGAALGDRFGRRKLFAIGLAIFTGGSALAALAGSANELIVARAIQGLGGAIVLPLTLTILSAAVPPNRRGLALGAWGGIGGLAAAPISGAVLLALCVLWELRATAAMLPMRFFRNRALTAAKLASLFMFFGMFGSIFLLAQYFQTVQGSSPLEAGLPILPWT